MVPVHKKSQGAFKTHDTVFLEKFDESVDDSGQPLDPQTGVQLDKSVNDEGCLLVGGVFGEFFERFGQFEEMAVVEGECHKGEVNDFSGFIRKNFELGKKLFVLSPIVCVFFGIG